MADIKSFGQALRHLREKKGLSYVEVADLTRADKKRVKAWEADAPPSPNTLQLKALYACFPPLKHYTTLLPKQSVDSIAFKLQKGIRDAETAMAKTMATSPSRGVARQAATDAFDREINWVPPVDRDPAPPDVTAPLPKPKTFGEALRQARVREGLSQRELSELIGVDSAATMSRWENNENPPVTELYDKLLKLLPSLAAGPKPGSRDIPKPIGHGDGPPGEAWRGRVREVLDKAEPEFSGPAFALRQLMTDPLTTARQMAEAINRFIEWARSIKTALPIHVVEHERMYPGSNGTPPAAALGAANVPEEAFSAPVTVKPDFGWRRCATFGGKGHLWNPAPGAVPPKALDSIPELACPYHAKPPVVLPDLPGVAGCGVKYGAALVELAKATLVRKGAEQFFEEAKLGEEIAAEDVTKTKTLLDETAQKEASDA